MKRTAPSFTRRSLRHKAAALLLPALLSAAAPLGLAVAQPVGLPDLGDSAAADLSPLIEQQLGDAIMAESIHDPTYVDDPDLIQYLTGMAHQLAATAPLGTPPLHVFPVSDPTINAFTMPGGYIGVQTGLVIATESEAELAGVVAHEIGHVVQRHLARNIGQGRQSTLIMLATLAAALAAASMGGGEGAMGALAFGQAAAVDRQLNFSRNVEREADRIGFMLLQNAGYNANGLAAFFQRLARVSGVNESTSQALMRDHPLTLERMSDMQDRARSVVIVNRPDSVDYPFVRAKMRVLQATDTQERIEAIRYFDGQAATETDGIRRAADYYGMALAWFKQQDYAKAGDALAKASSGMRTHYMLAGLEIDLAAARNDLDHALSLARAANARWPSQHGLALALAGVLQKMGRNQEAVDFLKEQIARSGDEEPHYYQVAAYSYERLGKRVDQNRSMADYYEQTGALAPAIELLQQARTASRDFYEQSQIDARLRELMRKDKEQRDLLKRFQS